MRFNYFITCILMCVLIALSGSSIPAEESQERELKQQLHDQRVAYRDALRKAFDVLHLRYIDGSDNRVCVSITRAALLDADLAIESESDKRLRKLEEYVDQLKQDERLHVHRFEIGVCRLDQLQLSVADRIQGEILLLEEQERQQRP